MKQRMYTILAILMICKLGFSQSLTSGLLQRGEIADKYKWNLTDIFANEEAWEEAYKSLQNEIPEYEKFRGKIGKSATGLQKALDFDNVLNERLEWLRLYAKMNRDVDMNSEQYAQMWSKYSSLEDQVNIASSFLEPEILSITERKLRRWVSRSDQLKKYEHYLTTLRRKEQHRLAQDQEDIVKSYEKLLGQPYEVYGQLVYAEIPFPTIQDEKGEDILLNRSTSWRARTAPDRAYRKRGYEDYYGALGKFKGTLAQNLTNHMNGKIVNAKIRGYDSALEAAFDQYNLPVAVYDTLIAAARANLQPFHRWMNLKKQLSGYDSLYIYDTRVSMFAKVEKEYSWEQGRDQMLNSLQVLGPDYVGEIKKAYDNRWVDAFPSVGKETGGYSTGPGGPHPYVKMNWGGKIMDYTTLVHEFGHYVHGQKTMQTQPFVYYNYPPFLSEIASTTAENIAWAYLIDNAKTPAEKLFWIEQFIEMVSLYFYTSTMNAEFERAVYQQLESGASPSAETLSEIYQELNRVYYGDAITLTEYDSNVWAEWPHFYFDYYIYSYATSFVASMQFSENIYREGEPAIERFTQFLESGGSDYPLNTLKKAGVDLTTGTPIIALTKVMNELIDEVEQLLASK